MARRCDGGPRRYDLLTDTGQGWPAQVLPTVSAGEQVVREYDERVGVQRGPTTGGVAT